VNPRRVTTSVLTAGLLAGLVAIVASPALTVDSVAEPAPRPARSRPPILAQEDTLKVYVVPDTTRVEASRIPLAEIIRKAQEGEQHKYDGISTLAFNRTIKLTLVYGGRKQEKHCFENVTRVYFRSPDGWVEAPLREDRYILEADGTRKPWEEKDEEVDVTVDEGPENARRLTEMPPYLEDTDKFDFEILHRSIKPDQVLYEIGFTPRSEFDVLPGGRVWLLTNGYQIVREEYEVHNLPVPWILKSLGLLTREWQQVGDHWLPRRITARVGLRGWIGLGIKDVPETAEVVVLYDAYELDPQLDPALFDKDRR
jgi:hypothetical protein